MTKRNFGPFRQYSNPSIKKIKKANLSLQNFEIRNLLPVCVDENKDLTKYTRAKDFDKDFTFNDNYLCFLLAYLTVYLCGCTQQQGSCMTPVAGYSHSPVPHLISQAVGKVKRRSGFRETVQRVCHKDCQKLTLTLSPCGNHFIVFFLYWTGFFSYCNFQILKCYIYGLLHAFDDVLLFLMFLMCCVIISLYNSRPGVNRT